jgi:hypothetical protein
MLLLAHWADAVLRAPSASAVASIKHKPGRTRLAESGFARLVQSSDTRPRVPIHTITNSTREHRIVYTQRSGDRPILHPINGISSRSLSIL